MIVLITGASSGFGEALVRKFAAHGHRVIAAARRMDRLQTLAAQLPDVLPLQLDVSDPDAIARAWAALPQTWRAVDVLINNAGLALGTEPAHRASWAEWNTMIHTNVLGLACMTHTVLPSMVERGTGLILNLGSVAGETPYPGGNVYGATKAFVEQFTRNLRADLLGTGVRAANIAPGLCGGTEFSLVRYRGDEEAARRVYDGTQPLTAEDIAETAFWIANLPAHVNINHIELMPTCQGYGPLVIRRDEGKV